MSGPIARAIPNVGLHVRSLDESLPFYRDLLGMAVLVDSGRLDDPALLALTATPGGAIRIVNLDGALARLAAAGVEPVAPAGEVSGGGAGHARVVFVRDPNGFFVELVRRS